MLNLIIFYKELAVNMSEITERLKDILATEGAKSIKDADVARELGINPNAYAKNEV